MFVKEILMGINSEELLTIVDNDMSHPAHDAATFGNTEALKIMSDSDPQCLFTPNNYDHLPIHFALCNTKIETFLYLFKQMKSYKVEYDELFRCSHGLNILHQVIDAGLIDVAYELINDYPSLANTMHEDKNTLECITRKPELFYSGTSYNFYSRFVYHVISRIGFKLWETTLLHVPHIKRLKDEKVKHNTTLKLFKRICEEVDRTHTLSDIKRLYSPIFRLAVENNNAEAVKVLTTYFAVLYNSYQDLQDIIEWIVSNHSKNVYIYMSHQERFSKFPYLRYIDDDGNNILHLAGRLAPLHKLNAASGAALQMQQELQWFEEVKKVVGITQRRELNKNKETPMMVFRKEHEKLRKNGEEWMKKTAESYTITAALIITIVFAAAITVPGGNDSATGKPIYETEASLIIFAISDAISLFTSTTSLLWFLSILTARYADEDFLYKLPKRLIHGLVMLFVSVTSMMIAFSATLYIMFGQEKAWILIPIGALAFLPIVSFVTLQFPLLVELISSTYGHGLLSTNANEYDY